MLNLHLYPTVNYQIYQNREDYNKNDDDQQYALNSLRPLASREYHERSPLFRAYRRPAFRYLCYLKEKSATAKRQTEQSHD